MPGSCVVIPTVWNAGEGAEALLLKRLPQRNVQQSACQGGRTQRTAPSLNGGSSLPVLPIKSRRLPVGARMANVLLKLAKLPFQHREF